MATGKGIENWKAKKWLNIYSPEILGNNTIGEMPADEEKDAMGRMIKVNMSWITNNPMHSFMVIGLKVTDVNGNAAHTQLKYLEHTFSYMHSLVKRHGSAIYTIDKANDKNGNNVVVKLLLISNTKLTTKKRMAIRRAVSGFMKEYIAKNENSGIVKDIIEGNLQKEGMNTVHKIANISKLEIKRLEM